MTGVPIPRNDDARCVVNVKLPRDLRDWLKHRAIHNQRTLTAEVAYRLQQSRRQEDGGTT